MRIPLHSILLNKTKLFNHPCNTMKLFCIFNVLKFILEICLSRLNNFKAAVFELKKKQSEILLIRIEINLIAAKQKSRRTTFLKIWSRLYSHTHTHTHLPTYTPITKKKHKKLKLHDKGNFGQFRKQFPHLWRTWLIFFGDGIFMNETESFLRNFQTVGD